MRQGTPFEVDKEVHERAKENARDKSAKYFYMAESDQNKLFSESIRYGMDFTVVKYMKKMESTFVLTKQAVAVIR